MLGVLEVIMYFDISKNKLLIGSLFYQNTLKITK